ncbi:MAG: hypothetical protein RIC80_14995 [Cyclobacteriaceae bacterium]
MKVFNWNSEKNQQLVEERGRSFEEATFHIENGGLLDDICHPDAVDYPHQKIFVVAIDQYAFPIAYVESDNECFLKTVIPGRRFTTLCLRGGS